MKIIATTAGGMLVEMSRSELIEVSGHDPLVRKLIENRDWSSPIGATFSVGTA